MQLPSAIPTDRSILFLRAMAMADPLSAAPPTTATKTMPMNTCDMPRALPVPSAAPTRISLIHAASTDATIRLTTARVTLHCYSPWLACPSDSASAQPVVLGADHILVTRSQRHQRNNQLGGIAKSRIQ